MLKELLPLLGSHIHDTSERVRIALLELLILVKNMRAIKVRTYVSMCMCHVYVYSRTCLVCMYVCMYVPRREGNITTFYRRYLLSGFVNVYVHEVYIRMYVHMYIHRDRMRSTYYPGVRIY